MIEVQESFTAWLEEVCGYTDVRQLPDGRYACIYPLMFTYAIVTVQDGDMATIEDRWCYYNYATARAALDDWDGTDEPSGWHKHPRTNRCRIDGDPEKETIGWAV
jgi:hypothetical protein